ncbi:deoxyribodipyrimidine photo-lyase [Nocardioides anomalus]|uniref:Deoxyribodipyrimidine photo-lyase n=1 Tax=Nocardioides anomalus TaxID=2712223 RepID=A0A6G6WJS4_9ACTN|nr:deoxyribodipyrimidine photo-lyase [Nocardioides anomalus]QIG45494.1 deoxyribodipyrimidine photo-lyase [Nocardioides anomalus]
MPRTSLMVFTRDLRVHDNPALVAAAKADRVVPLFVLDTGVLRLDYTNANKGAFLAGCLEDLDASLKQRGGGLVVRRGRWVTEVTKVAEEVGADEVHVNADHSGYAQRRLEALGERVELTVHQGLTVVEPGAVTPAGKTHYGVFSPYFRAWEKAEHREPVGAPRKLSVPRVAKGDLPSPDDIAKGERAPDLAEPGETAGRRLMQAWLKGGIDAYDERHDDLPGDATSRLSAYLHWGCLSPAELVAKAGRSAGEQAFVRQLAWRDFNLQLLAHRPELSHEDLRPKGDRWRQEGGDFDAWREGRTGIPVVDAGMRQLLREGWMHNRARLIVGSFLTKHLYVDWRLGAAHFLAHLLDGDIANNQLNWQWIAGTGADSRPNRVLAPLRQAQRFDPQGDYVRRYVEELSGVEGKAVHTPWELPDDVRKDLDYPDPLVDLDEARKRFLAKRQSG